MRFRSPVLNRGHDGAKRLGNTERLQVLPDQRCMMRVRHDTERVGGSKPGNKGRHIWDIPHSRIPGLQVRMPEGMGERFICWIAVNAPQKALRHIMHGVFPLLGS